MLLKREAHDKKSHPAEQLGVGMSKDVRRPSGRGVTAHAPDAEQCDSAKEASDCKDADDASEEERPVYLNRSPIGSHGSGGGLPQRQNVQLTDAHAITSVGLWSGSWL